MTRAEALAFLARNPGVKRAWEKGYRGLWNKFDHIWLFAACSNEADANTDLKEVFNALDKPRRLSTHQESLNPPPSEDVGKRRKLRPPKRKRRSTRNT